MAGKSSLSSFEQRRTIRNKEKTAIAQFVTANLLPPGETLFLGAGTTVSYIGEEIAKKYAHASFKIWTNNIGLINLWLAKYEAFFAFNFVGIVEGEFSSKNMSIINLSLPVPEIPKVIIGSPAVSAKGLSADSIATGYQVDSLIKRTKEIIVVADASKIGTTETYLTRSARMLKLDIARKKRHILVTTAPHQENCDIFRDETARLERMGVQIRVVRNATMKTKPREEEGSTK